MNRNWRGLVLDGDAQNIAAVYADDIAYKHDLKAVASFITAENINESIERAGFGERIGLLSVDLDGIDWWVLKALNVAAMRLAATPSSSAQSTKPCCGQSCGTSALIQASSGTLATKVAVSPLQDIGSSCPTWRACR
jgi:hypothetical protein